MPCGIGKRHAGKGEPMTYDETSTARITPRQAIIETLQHGSKTEVKNGWIVCSYTYEKIVKIDTHGLVKGRIVLDWLGY